MKKHIVVAKCERALSFAKVVYENCCYFYLHGSERKPNRFKKRPYITTDKEFNILILLLKMENTKG